MVQQSNFLRKRSAPHSHTWKVAGLSLIAVLFISDWSMAQPVFANQPAPALKLKKNPMPICEEGLANPLFIEALDDHFNAVFAGISLEERLAKSTLPSDMTKEDQLQSISSEVYTGDVRMKTNSLVKKFKYSMPFSCLNPIADGKGFSFQLSSIPCNDPETSLAALQDIKSEKTRKIIKDLLRSGSASGGGTSAGTTQIIQGCSVQFVWNASRKRFYAEKSFVKEVSSAVEDEQLTSDISYKINTRTHGQSKMDCPLTSRLVLGCNIRLHPRSEKHLTRLTQSDWMPAREAVICELAKDPGVAFDLEVATIKKQIQANPGIYLTAGESQEDTLVRLVRDRLQVSSKETLPSMRQSAIDFLAPRACNHLQPNAICNVVTLVKKHRYAPVYWDSMDYGILSADKQTIRGFNPNFSVGPFTENRSYHDLPGMVGRSFLFGDDHRIYQAGGNPSHREVEMFCAESK